MDARTTAGLETGATTWLLRNPEDRVLVRQRFEFVIAGYVLMPEHVHLLVSEPRSVSLATALQVLKQ